MTASLSIVYLLGMVCVCKGIDLSRRDTEVEEMDWRYDVPGLHLGIKFNDTEHPLRKGKVYLKLDASKLLRQQEQFNTIELAVDYKIELPFWKTFVTKVNYTIGHNDGHGEESGQMKVQYRRRRNAWSFIIQSKTSSFIGKPIIPPDISNHGIHLNLDIGKVDGIRSDIPKKFTIKTIKTLNGARENVLTFQFDELSFRQNIINAIFSMVANVTSFEEPVTGEAKAKVITIEPNDAYWGIKIFDSVQLEIKVFHGARQDDIFCQIEDMRQQKTEPYFTVEGNGTINQESMNIKGELTGLKDEFDWHIINPYFEATINYTIWDVDTSGMVLRFEHFAANEVKFTIGNTNYKAKKSFEIIISSIANRSKGLTMQIEYKENENSKGLWKTTHDMFASKGVLNMILNTEIELTHESKIYQYLHEKHPNLVFNSTGIKMKILADTDKFWWENSFENYQIEFKLEKDGVDIVDFIADTFVDPHVFKLIAPNILPGDLRRKQPSIDQSLIIDTNNQGELYMEGELGDTAKNGKDLSLQDD